MGKIGAILGDLGVQIRIFVAYPPTSTTTTVVTP